MAVLSFLPVLLQHNTQGVARGSPFSAIVVLVRARVERCGGCVAQILAAVSTTRRRLRAEGDMPARSLARSLVCLLLRRHVSVVVVVVVFRMLDVLTTLRPGRDSLDPLLFSTRSATVAGQSRWSVPRATWQPSTAGRAASMSICWRHVLASVAPLLPDVVDQNNFCPGVCRDGECRDA